jgi:hypothetical protein
MPKGVESGCESGKFNTTDKALPGGSVGSMRFESRFLRGTRLH